MIFFSINFVWLGTLDLLYPFIISWLRIFDLIGQVLFLFVISALCQFYIVKV